MSYTFLSVVLAAIIFSFVEVNCKCTNPEVNSEVTYSTPDALLSRETVYSILLTLSCANDEQPPLYALLDGELVPLTREPGTGNYQISWTRPHKNPFQSQDIQFYDDESASSFRKSIRYGEEVKVSSLFAVRFDYKGIKFASAIAPGFVAMCLALLVWYLANSARQKLQE